MSKATADMFKVLKALYEIDEAVGGGAKVHPNDIENSTGLQTTMINRIIDMLQQSGLVKAEAWITYYSYKHKWVVLQPKGKEAYKKMASSTKEAEKTTPVKKAPSKNPKDVAVVHGRNDEAREAIFMFLRAIGLNPLEWSELVASTGEGTPYIGQVLDKAFSDVQAIVVLMTPDDEGMLRVKFHKIDDGIHEKQLTPQARLNVVFEAGMAFGFNPKRTILVELGYLRPFSNIGGRHTVKLDDTPDKRLDLAQRLETAGCQVNIKGRDWLKAGDFSASLKKSNKNTRLYK